MSPGPPLQAKLRSDLRGYAVFPSGAYRRRPSWRQVLWPPLFTGRCRAYGYSRMRSRLTKAGAAGHIGSTPRRWWGAVGVLYPWASTDPFPLSTMAACRSNQHLPAPICTASTAEARRWRFARHLRRFQLVRRPMQLQYLALTGLHQNRSQSGREADPQPRPGTSTTQPAARALPLVMCAVPEQHARRMVGCGDPFVLSPQLRSSRGDTPPAPWLAFPRLFIRPVTVTAD